MQLEFSIYEVLPKENSLVIKFRCSACCCTVWSEKEYDVVENYVPADYIKNDEELLNKLENELKPLVEKSKLNFSVEVHEPEVQEPEESSNQE